MNKTPQTRDSTIHFVFVEVRYRDSAALYRLSIVFNYNTWTLENDAAYH